MPDDDRLMITDPKAIRAMANPIRLTAVDELYRTQAPMTATELAGITGITASAMSYHLRGLDAFGIIRPHSSLADARERPWVASARNYSIVSSDDEDATQRAILIDTRIQPMKQRMESLLQHRSQTSSEDRPEKFMVLATGNLLLTDEEFERLQVEVMDVFDRYEGIGAKRSQSESFRRGRYMWSTLPERPAPGD